MNCTLYLLSFVCIVGCGVCKSDGTERKISSELYCENETSPIVHVFGEGKQDVINYLYSTAGSFVILTALTPINANLHINCTKFSSENKSGAVSFSKTPYYSFAVILTNLYEFLDTKDVADISNIPKENITTIPFSNFTWKKPELDDSMAKITFSIVETRDKKFLNDSVQFTVSAMGSQGRYDTLPHLVHTANSTQIELVINKVATIYEKPRFAVEALLIGNQPENRFSISYTRSLDDEFTPGVFKIVQIWSTDILKGGLGGYVQWKPTVYTKSKHEREHSTATSECCLSSSHLTNDTFLESLANAFYGATVNQTFSESLKVTFGMEGDKFFTNTNYSSWTLSVGYGTPPEDEVSTLLIGVIAIGVGIPFLLLIAGGIFVLVKRYRNRKDDLLLSE